MPGAFCKDYTIFTSCPVFCSWVSSYICLVSIYSHCICNELSDSSIFIPMFFRMFFLIVLKSVIFLLYLPLLRLLSYVFLIPIFAAYHLEQTCFCWSSIISLPFLSRPGHIIIFSYSKFRGDVCWYFVPYAIHIFCCHTAQLLTKYGTLFHNLMHCNTVCYSYRSFFITMFDYLFISYNMHTSSSLIPALHNFTKQSFSHNLSKHLYSYAK